MSNNVGENAVFIGNMRHNCSKGDLNKKLHDLFTQYLHINIERRHIDVKGKSNRHKHAFIEVPSKKALKDVLDQLGSKESRMTTGFKFLDIVNQGETLKVAKKLPPKNLKNGEGVQQSEIDQTGDNQNAANVNNVNGGGREAQGIETVGRFYQEGQRLKNESIDTEYKIGGGNYIKDILKEDVSKYICGFLNSQQKGTLYIGVEDEGCKVVGIECDQKKEDAIRLSIDSAIETIRPHIFPGPNSNYCVEFVPVYRGDQIKQDWKVLEITVEKVDNLTELYATVHATGETVFIRKDGSIKQLTTAAIQQWHKQVLEKQKKEFEARLRKAKSKVCVIS